MKKKKLIGFLSLYALIMFLVLNFKLGGNYFNLINNVFNFSTILIALYFGFLAIKYFKLKNIQGKIALFISLSIFLWLIADLVWLINDYAVISIADLFYLLGYSFMSFSLFLGIKLVNQDFLKDKKILVFILFLTIILTYLYFLIMPIKWDLTLTFIENLLTTGYVIADFILLIPTTILIIIIWNGSYKETWLYILIGLIFLIIGDTIYTINYNSYTEGSFMNLVWYYSYLFFSLGLFSLKEISKITLNNFKNVIKKGK